MTWHGTVPGVGVPADSRQVGGEAGGGHVVDRCAAGGNGFAPSPSRADESNPPGAGSTATGREAAAP
jgi:hypothetical protein